jgi:hypothetical protein
MGMDGLILMWDDENDLERMGFRSLELTEGGI